MRAPLPRVQINPIEAQGPAPGPRFVQPVDTAGPQAEAVGNALGRFAANAFRAADEAQADIDEARIREADTAADDAWRMALRDPQNGYLTRVGKDASQAYRTQVFEEADKRVDEIASKLETPEQRRNFAAIAARRRESAMQMADQHQVREARAYNMGETKARAERFAQSAADAYGTDQYAEMRAAAEAEVGSYARQAGFGAASEQATALRQTIMGPMHADVVQRLVTEGKSAEANGYLGEIPPQDFAPGVRVRLQKLVAAGTADDLSWKVATFVAEKAPGDLGKQREMLDAMRSGGQIKDQEVYDRALARLRADASEQWTQQQRARVESMREFEDAVQLNPVESWDQLDATTQQKLINSGNENTAKLFLRQGRQFVTSNEGLAELLALSDEDLAKVEDFTTLRAKLQHHLSPANMQSLQRRWDRATNKKTARGLGVTDIDEVVLFASRDAKLIGKNPSFEETDRLDRIQHEVKVRLAGQMVDDNLVRKTFAEVVATMGTAPKADVKLAVPIDVMSDHARNHMIVETGVPGVRLVGPLVSTTDPGDIVYSPSALDAEVADIRKININNTAKAKATGGVWTPLPETRDYAIRRMAERRAAEVRAQIDRDQWPKWNTAKYGPPWWGPK